jgi:flavodoxin
MMVKVCISCLLNIWLLNTAFSQQSDSNVLIVYLTRTNNTKAVAEMIHEKVGNSMLVALVPENPYPENYQEIVDQVDRENENDYLPPLKTQIDSIEQYDVVFLGFPTWDMQMPPPMKSFLNQNDFSGKTVIPFNTNAGFGVGSGFDMVKSMCPNASVLEGLSIEGGHERKGIYLAIKDKRAKEVENLVDEWLCQLKISRCSR